MNTLKGFDSTRRTFIGSSSTYDSAEAVIVGVPMDCTVSFKTGSRTGPGIIREMSSGLETYSPYLKGDLKDISLYDHGDLVLHPGNTKESLNTIYNLAAKLFRDEKTPIILGGEHLISLPVIKAAFDRYGHDLILFQFDAHTDLREEYLGERLSHATVIKRCMDFMKGNNIYQFGIRSGLKEEFLLGKRETNFYPFKIIRPLQKIVKTIGGRPLYITLDIDVVDPAYAPGTGTPEPGGCDVKEILETVHIFKGCNIIGMDLVEVMSCGDPAGITGMLAAKIIREVLIAAFSGNKNNR